MVVDGPGTVAFASGAVQFSGVAEVKQGTLDLSAAGTVSNLKVKGPGAISGGTLSNPTIVLDADSAWGESSVPMFSGCAFSGTVKIDCGRTEANPLTPSSAPVVVARFTGAAPNVSGWRLVNTGTTNIRGNFTVSGDTVVATVRETGFVIIYR